MYICVCVCVCVCVCPHTHTHTHIYKQYIFKISSHLLTFHMGNFPGCFPIKILRAFLVSSIVPTCQYFCSFSNPYELTFTALATRHRHVSFVTETTCVCCYALQSSSFVRRSGLLVADGHAVRMIHSQALWGGLTGAWIPLTLMKWLLLYCCVRNDLRQRKCGGVMELSAGTELVLEVSRSL